MSSVAQVAETLLTMGNTMVADANGMEPTPRNGSLYHDPQINPNNQTAFRVDALGKKCMLDLEDGKQACFYHDDTNIVTLFVGNIDQATGVPKGPGTLYKNITFTSCDKKYSGKSTDEWATLLRSNSAIPSDLYTHSYTGTWTDTFCLHGKATYVEKKCTIVGDMTTYMVEGAHKYKFVSDVDITYTNGDRFHGKLHDHDVFIPCAGHFAYQNGNSYRGTFPDYVQGKTTSFGTYVGTDGHTYTGMFKNDLKDGNGVLVFENGDRFTGTFKEDRPVNGTLITYPDTIRTKRYTGPVSEGFDPHGKGELVTRFNLYSQLDLSKYEGDFHLGKKQGTGTEFISITAAIRGDGDIIPGTVRKEGTWLNDDFRDGKLTFFTDRAENKYAREGTFVGGCQRSGKYFHPNGDIYDGTFNSDGAAHGTGMLLHTDGRIECGQWANNQRHGQFETMQKGNLASSPGTEPQEYFYTKKTSAYVTNVEQANPALETKKRKRDYDAFQESCRNTCRQCVRP